MLYLTFFLLPFVWPEIIIGYYIQYYYKSFLVFSCFWHNEFVLSSILNVCSFMQGNVYCFIGLAKSVG